MNPMIFLIALGILLIVGLGYIYYRNKKSERASQLLKTAKKNGRNYMFSVYVMFTSIPGLRSYFYKLANRVQHIYPADEISTNLRATKILFRTMLVGLVVVIITINVADGDLFFIFAGITMTYIMLITLIDRSLESIEIKLMKQLRDFIDQIREQYNRLGRVDDAMSYTIDTLPYEISLHAVKLHAVLISTDITKAVNRYIDTAPNKFFMTLAAISATTMEYGDKKLERGDSLFLKNLNFLKEEVNIELLKQQKNNNLFSGLTIVSLLPIFAIKPIENWAVGNMPEIATFYKGAYGIVSMAAIFFFSAVSYTIVRTLKNGRTDDTRETSIFKTIAEIPGIRKYLSGQVRRNYTKALRHNDMLRFTGDRMGINAFLVKRYFVAILAGIMVFSLITTSIIRDKSTQLHDFAEAFDTSLVPDKEYRQTMESIAEDMTISMHKMGVDANSQAVTEDITKEILTTTSIKKESEAQMIANVVVTHLNRYDKVYFKWWYLLMVYVGALVGYMIPLWILIFKQRSIRLNMEDEVSQFQTLALMLMHVDGVNTVMLLEWIERFAYCFKESISECIIDLPHKGQKALEKMQNVETFQPFQSFCNNLLSIDAVGVEKAFANVETDREYYKEKRKADNEMLMNRKAAIGKWVAILPLVFVFGAYLIYPMVSLAMTMMDEVGSAI